MPVGGSSWVVQAYRGKLTCCKSTKVYTQNSQERSRKQHMYCHAQNCNHHMPQSFIPRLLSTSQPAIEFETHATHEDVGKGNVNTSHSMHMRDNIFPQQKKTLQTSARLSITSCHALTMSMTSMMLHMQPHSSNNVVCKPHKSVSQCWILTEYCNVAEQDDESCSHGRREHTTSISIVFPPLCEFTRE
jgi:hypothetical protein